MNLPTEAHKLRCKEQLKLLESINAQNHTLLIMHYTGASCTGTDFLWSDPLRRIISYHSKGSRILIFMRGFPGCGKSRHAKQIIEMTIGTSSRDYKTHIFSTKDYYLMKGINHYDGTKLYQDQWNYNRVKVALCQGLSPVIVDDNNIEHWEMLPYIREGLENGYMIEIIEPCTPWAKKVNHNFGQNIHYVPSPEIQKMLMGFQTGLTGDYLLKYYRLKYPENMVPPIMRNLPAVQNILNNQNNLGKNNQNTKSSSKDSTYKQSVYTKTDFTKNHQVDKGENTIALCDSTHNFNESEDRMIKLEKRNIKNCNKAPPEAINISNQTCMSADLESLRTNNAKPIKFDKNFKTVQKFEESPVCMPLNIKTDKITVEIVSSSTCVEKNHTDLHPKQVLSTVPSNFNLFHISNNNNKTPEKTMYDTSTLTGNMPTNNKEASTCQNEEQRVSNTPAKEELDSMFEDKVTNQLGMVDDEEISENGKDSMDLYNLALHNVIPDVTIKETTVDHRSQTPVETGIIKQQNSKIVPSNHEMQQNLMLDNSSENTSQHSLQNKKILHTENILNEHEESILIL